ncbi:hypothetical protein FQR65_LT12968 [Abscondita terminalis]|nr:hypothetical protein FQR65_LT12968 [Abscondita terminalis]
MKFNFTRGQRLIIELTDKNVLEGNYESGTKNQIDLTKIIDLETRTPIQGRLTFYQHEIISVKLLESEDSTDSILNSSDEVSTSTQQLPNVISLARAEYERLQTMIHSCMYFATADKRYLEAIEHLSGCENVGVVGLGSDFGPTKPIDLLVMCSWDQIYIFDLLSYQYSNFPNDLKDILESQYIKKVGHNLLKLTECLWFCHRVRVKNIFDTMFADLEVSNKKDNDKEEGEMILSNQARSLACCLTVYFNFPSTVLDEAGDITSDKWKERPLKDSRKIKAALLVAYLIILKNKLEYLMLKNFYDKIDDATNNIQKNGTYQGCDRVKLNGVKSGLKNMCLN